MKKSNTNLTITITEGGQNIQFLLDFLANAKRDYLLVAKLDQLEKLQQLLAAGTDDQLFERAFPQRDIENFLDQNGKPLTYVHGSKSSHLRHCVILHCARKAYDMLTSGYCREKYDEMEVERFAACDQLYDTSVALTQPATAAQSLREHVISKTESKARVS